MLSPHCTICSGIYTQNEHITSTPCGHIYHNECLYQWLNTSPTCPQCRRNCPLGGGNRIYMDFADDEFLATTSTRISPVGSQRPNPTTEVQEETIKILLEHIDEDAWKTEEMDNHLAEFDARNEELSKVKSIVDEQSETSKTILTAFDSILIENERLAQVNHEQEHQFVNLQRMNGELMRQVQQLEETIRMNQHNYNVMRDQLENVEAKANAHQWEINCKNNEIHDLQDVNRLNGIEINILCDQIKELKVSGVEHKRYGNGFSTMIQTVFKQNISLKMLQHLKQSKTQSQLVNRDASANDTKAVVPFCGSIEEWDFIMVPVLKTFTASKPNSQQT